jgi:predicted enzyme related to lactoylglutathione lyase
MPRVIHFEIHADNPDRAAKFYEKAFGWKTQKAPNVADYWLVATGEKNQPGIDGAIMKRVNKGTTRNTIDVPSVDEFIKKILKAGGKVTQQKVPIPGVGYWALCADTEGNEFGILQEDRSAK